MEKKKVRALAKRFNLPVAEKKDSQGVCFLGSVSVKEFLEQEFGTNNPALLYTIGQRAPGGYVIGKNIEKKEITVSKTRASGAREVRFTDANWLREPTGALEAQYRYRGPRIPGRIENECFISVEPIPEIPAPGQSVVFYQDNNLIGGGIIA